MGARQGLSDQRAKVDAVANMGMSNASAASDQHRLADRASAKWGG
jgi:hypothetical protein